MALENVRITLYNLREFIVHRTEATNPAFCALTKCHLLLSKGRFIHLAKAKKALVTLDWMTIKPKLE